MTGAMCIGAASRIPGTIPNQYSTHTGDNLTIGHPKGKVTVGVSIGENENASDTLVQSISNRRTARPLMRGNVYYRYSGILEQLKE